MLLVTINKIVRRIRMIKATLLSLLLATSVSAGEENGKEGLGFCMAAGTVAGEVQRVRQTTDHTMEQMMSIIVDLNPKAPNLGQVLSIIGGVYTDIDKTMPPAMVSTIVADRCLDHHKIEKMIEPEDIMVEEVWI